MPRPAPLVAAAAAVLLPLAACTAARSTAGPAVAASVPSVHAVPHPTLSAADAWFLDGAARSGLAEVREGTLARERASRPEVRRYAAAVLADRAHLNDELAALAARARITLPTMPSAVQQQMMGELLGLSGPAFDRAYLDQQVVLHQSVVELFADEARHGSNPDMKAFAGRALPLLRRHMIMAEQLGGRPPSA